MVVANSVWSPGELMTISVKSFFLFFFVNLGMIRQRKERDSSPFIRCAYGTSQDHKTRKV